MNGPTVVFALSEKVRRDFLPGFDQSRLPPMRDLWPDFSGMDSEAWRLYLETERPEVLVTGWGSPMLSDPDKLDAHPSYLCHLTGSLRSQLNRAWLEQGLLASNWGSVISHTIAEHALLLVLASLRQLPLWEHSRSGDASRTSLRTRSLRGKHVGLHGFGAIARELVSLLRPFGVSLAAYSSGVPARHFLDHGVRPCVSLEDLFSSSDILIEVESLTAQTKGIVNGELLRLLPEEAVFVNVGRGAVVDEVALVDLAGQKKLRVGLDVYAQEPLPLDSPLRKIPHVLLSPHIAGPTEDTYPLCGEHALRNLEAYLSGQREKMTGVVTLAIFDRST